MENQHLTNNFTKEAEHLSEIISFSKQLHSMKKESRASILHREIVLALPQLMPLF